MEKKMLYFRLSQNLTVGLQYSICFLFGFKSLKASQETVK